jgi:hypothetical protein
MSSAIFAFAVRTINKFITKMFSAYKAKSINFKTPTNCDDDNYQSGYNRNHRKDNLPIAILEEWRYGFHNQLSLPDTRNPESLRERQERQKLEVL